MERKLVLRGMLAGAIAGVAAFVFARIFAEPQIQAAIDYENGRDAAQQALDKASGLPTVIPGMEIFSRAVQANVGIGTGIVVVGIAMGLLYSVAYAFCLGRVGRLRPRTLAMLTALGGFLGTYLVPFIKYPANPPAIGHPDTIGQRGNLYLAMVACSLLLLVGATVLGRRLQARLGTWNATLVAGTSYAVGIGVVMTLLPQLGELPANVSTYGHHATETPLPLTDAKGTIVYPGFPADTLFSFRLHSAAAQLILWTTLGLIYAPMAERLLTPQPPRATAPTPREPNPVGAP